MADFVYLNVDDAPFVDSYIENGYRHFSAIHEKPLNVVDLINAQRRMGYPIDKHGIYNIKIIDSLNEDNYFSATWKCEEL